MAGRIMKIQTRTVHVSTQASIHLLAFRGAEVVIHADFRPENGRVILCGVLPWREYFTAAESEKLSGRDSIGNTLASAENCAIAFVPLWVRLQVPLPMKRKPGGAGEDRGNG